MNSSERARFFTFKDSSWHLTLKFSRWIYGSLIYILRFCSSSPSSHHHTARMIVNVVKEEEIDKEEEIGIEQGSKVVLRLIIEEPSEKL